MKYLIPFLFIGFFLIPEAQAQTEWSRWDSMTDDSGLEYRYKFDYTNEYISGGHIQVWWIEVRNNYNEKMHVDMTITPRNDKDGGTWTGFNIESNDTQSRKVFSKAPEGSRITIRWKNIDEFWN